MKTIIAGSRTLEPFKDLCLQKIRDLVNKENIKITFGVSGGAKGPDKFGEEYFKEIGVEFEVYPALWLLYGKQAGIIRNIEMKNNADQLIALLDKNSKTGGTRHMISIAKEANLKVWIIEIDINDTHGNLPTFPLLISVPEIKPYSIQMNLF